LWLCVERIACIALHCMCQAHLNEMLFLT
jgi:hypothetical protein